ncbi:hypothetical protein BDV06DRAFT_224075 [Aspergillus oleicola]
MGCVDVFPDIEGYRENWLRNMFVCPPALKSYYYSRVSYHSPRIDLSSTQCIFCDGYDRYHLPGGVLTFPSPVYWHIAEMMNLLITEASAPGTLGVGSETVIRAEIGDVPGGWKGLFEGANVGKLITSLKCDD